MLVPFSRKLLKVAYNCGGSISKTARFSSFISLKIDKLTSQRVLCKKSVGVLPKPSLDHVVQCFCSKSDSKLIDNTSKSDDNSSENVNTPTKTEDNTLSSETDLFSDVDFDEITGGDEEMIKQLKVFILEIDVQRQEGYEVPSKITTEQWKNLMELSSWHRRKKYLRFLFLNEKKAENDRKRKERNRLLREELYQKRLEEEKENPPHMKYCLYNNSIFIRISDTTMHRYENNRLVNAMMYGQNLVIDCGFDSYMTMKEASNCGQQLTYVFSENRSHIEPFNLHLCNVGYKDRVIKVLSKYIPTMFEESYPINVTDKHYLELFPKERLVYLTPHCNNDLGKYDPNDIYIIGAIVDKTNVEPLTLAKAKSEGLRMARFPLDKYLDWGCGSKSLTVDQSVRIMLTLKETNDWYKAFQHVPSRKIVREVEEPDDCVSHYGQSYVGNSFEQGHEWGIAKRRERAKMNKHLDLRELLHKKEKHCDAFEDC
ncbi:hypothetical protein LSTR_LSTR009973 [Laodelphax striatellus]|uniref:RNA (guanine-9-)-methyltransferase domain-containing protein 1 n=1 Tax=Laodelphax striatellus TaxID=195883 RepID=A0A482WHD5_LAOST|nr:hypothetical protein LSTR_LSTR009973 [Laodelphax striatellus]